MKKLSIRYLRRRFPKKIRKLHNQFQLKQQLEAARRDMASAPPPVFIGASDGSGTRLVTQLLQSAGFFMGSQVNVAGDSIAVGPFLKRWLPPYLQNGQSAAMAGAFQQALLEHRLEIPDPQQRWGVKNPRSLLMLPFYQQQVPAMRFVHVVRDGRDMAFSDKVKPLQALGSILLDVERLQETQPLQLASLWNRVNLDANWYGHEQMGDRYLLIRFEDLCRHPQHFVRQLFEFVGVNSDIDAAVQLVRVPQSIGRYQKHPSTLINQITTVAEQGLRHFEYLP